MISVERLAEVIQESTGYETIDPGAATVCAEAVLAAIRRSIADPNDSLRRQTMTCAQWGENDGIVAEQLAKLKEDALDATRFRFIKARNPESFTADIDAAMARSTLVPDPKISIPMPEGYTLLSPAPQPRRSGMSDDERELLIAIADGLWPLLPIPTEDLHRGAISTPAGDRIRGLLERIKP